MPGWWMNCGLLFIHLRHVFEKTETNREADLVKLVAAYMSPLAG
jgi:hypothetical protein